MVIPSPARLLAEKIADISARTFYVDPEKDTWRKEDINGLADEIESLLESALAEAKKQGDILLPIAKDSILGEELLRRAKQEAYEEGLEHGHTDALKELDAQYQLGKKAGYEQGYKQATDIIRPEAYDAGRTAGYLDAAKIAEDSKSYKIGLCGTQQVFDHWNDAMNYMAEKLRRLANEVGGVSDNEQAGE